MPRPAGGRPARVLRAIMRPSRYAIVCVLYAYTRRYVKPLHAFDRVNIMHVSAYVCAARFAGGSRV